MADALYANVDVSQLLEEKLPENLQGLAGPIAGLSQEYAARAADELLARPQVAERCSSRRRRSRRSSSSPCSTATRSCSRRRTATSSSTCGRSCCGSATASTSSRTSPTRSPRTPAQITIVASDDLDMAQKVVHWLELVANWIWILALASWVAAFLLVKGRRRQELRAIGIGLAVAGVAVLVVRSLAGGYFVDNVVKTDSVRPAAEEAWRIITDGLAQSAWGVDRPRPDRRARRLGRRPRQAGDDVPRLDGARAAAAGARVGHLRGGHRPARLDPPAEPPRDRRRCSSCSPASGTRCFAARRRPSSPRARARTSSGA